MNIDKLSIKGEIKKLTEKKEALEQELKGVKTTLWEIAPSVFCPGFDESFSRLASYERDLCSKIHKTVGKIRALEASERYIKKFESHCEKRHGEVKQRIEKLNDKLVGHHVEALNSMGYDVELKKGKGRSRKVIMTFANEVE